MSGFKVDRDVPIPDAGHGPGAKPKYPWREMGHGDSVRIQLTEADKRRRTERNGDASACTAARDWIRRNRPEWRVVTRAEGEDAVRIWFLDLSKNGDDR